MIHVFATAESDKKADARSPQIPAPMIQTRKGLSAIIYHTR